MDFSEIQQIVNEKLGEISMPGEPRGLYEPIDYELKVGGKRLRPAFALFACQLFSGQIDKAMNSALALEFFHNFTLMHDDIMDNADRRRGKPTVHRVWNVNTAILSGDTMMGKAYELMLKNDSSILAPVLGIFSQTVIGVMEGQQYDMNFEVRSNVTIPEYMRMIYLKTAVLIAASFKIGALCGGASAADADALYEFGINVGLCFQLQDDLLDVYADPEKFGKNLGGDICDNKKTFLYLKALEKAEGSIDEEQLRRWFRVQEFDREQKIAAVTDIYNRLEISQEVMVQMNLHLAEGRKALEASSLSREQKEQLNELAASLLSRDV